MRVTRGAGLLCAAVLLACGGGSDGKQPTTPNTPNTPGTPGTPSTSSQITVEDNQFSPSATTVPLGTTVTWTWGAVYNQHDVTFNDGSATSGAKTSGTYQRTLTTAGAYGYRCSIHGAAMSGTVTVAP